MDILNRIIDFSLRHRFLVIVGAMVFAVAGGLSMRYLDIDAFPDTTPIQVQINTVAPALGPEEVEQAITFPIEQAIGSLPGLEEMRSISKFGLSQVVVTFKDGVDIYFARQLINERLGHRRTGGRHRAAENGTSRHRVGRSVSLHGVRIRQRFNAGPHGTRLDCETENAFGERGRGNQQLGRL